MCHCAVTDGWLVFNIVTVNWTDLCVSLPFFFSFYESVIKTHTSFGTIFA